MTFITAMCEIPYNIYIYITCKLYCFNIILNTILCSIYNIYSIYNYNTIFNIILNIVYKCLELKS